MFEVIMLPFILLFVVVDAVIEFVLSVEFGVLAIMGMFLYVGFCAVTGNTLL